MAVEGLRYTSAPTYIHPLLLLIVTHHSVVTGQRLPPPPPCAVHATPAPDSGLVCLSASHRLHLALDSSGCMPCHAGWSRGGCATSTCVSGLWSPITDSGDVLLISNCTTACVSIPWGISFLRSEATSGHFLPVSIHCPLLHCSSPFFSGFSPKPQ